MALNPEQVGQLLTMIRQTKELELTCPECLDELDRYIQSILNGDRLDDVLKRVREHLEACSCCASHFELVLETLKAIEE